MTPEEIQELRDWSARKMGWKLSITPLQDFYTGMITEEPSWIDEHGKHILFVKYFCPDRPESGQIWMLVERMREDRWWLNFTGADKDELQHIVSFRKTMTKPVYESDPNPCLAILKAAKATED